MSQIYHTLGMAGWVVLIMQTDLDQDLTLVWLSQAYLVNYVLQLKLSCFHKLLMHGLRYILLIFLVVEKTKFLKNGCKRNGQGTFS